MASESKVKKNFQSTYINTYPHLDEKGFEVRPDVNLFYLINFLEFNFIGRNIYVIIKIV